MRKRSLPFILTILVASLLLSVTARGQAQAASDPWQSLRFLMGTWDAKTTSGTAAAQSNGIYSFGLELKDHILARHSSSGACKAPADFNCDHSDLLYLFLDHQSIKAIYFDNEGHVIHYSVSTPTPASVVFLSDSSLPGPQFRLAYERSQSILSGKFQMKMPGQSEFTSYLEWSGNRK